MAFSCSQHVRYDSFSHFKFAYGSGESLPITNVDLKRQSFELKRSVRNVESDIVSIYR